MKLLFVSVFCILFNICTSYISNFELPRSDGSECGPFEVSRIHKGEIAKIFDHPWFALLRIEKDQCGGTLINHLHVLTAAHCFKNTKTPVESTRVIIGEFDTRINPENYWGKLIYSIEYEISRLTLHDNYQINDANYYNDIAVVRLKNNVERVHYGEYIYKLGCLPLYQKEQEIDLVGKTLTVSGFGYHNTPPEFSKLSKIKRKTDMRVISAQECQERLDKHPKNNITIDNEMQFCALDINGTDSCNGDSGGPFVLNNKLVMGLVSFGFTDCGSEIFPAIYTRISNYIDFIMREVAFGASETTTEGVNEMKKSGTA